MKAKARSAIVEPGRLVEDLAGIGERRDHQAVPVGQHLVVEAGPHARCAGGKQLCAQRGKPLLVLLAARKRLETIENIVAFEIAVRRDVVVAREEFAVLGAERLRSRRHTTRRRTCPPRLRNRHRAKRRTRPRPSSFRARASRRSRARAGGTAACGSAHRRWRAVRGAARCRRASSRNAGRASARRPNSARSRRRDDRRCRPRRCGEA